MNAAVEEIGRADRGAHLHAAVVDQQGDGIRDALRSLCFQILPYPLLHRTLQRQMKRSANDRLARRFLQKARGEVRGLEGKLPGSTVTQRLRREIQQSSV